MKLKMKEWIAKVTSLADCDLLYSGSLNNGGSVQLSKSVTNYKKIIIVAKDNDGVYKTFEHINNKASSFATYCDYTRLYGAWYCKSAYIAFNGTTMTMTKCGQAYFSGQAQGDYVTVEKVYGCKHIVGGYCVTQLLQGLQPFPRLEVA